jgi:DNA-directed RNA polymerase subunit M/transcription elongation factor TFIIS
MGFGTLVVIVLVAVVVLAIVAAAAENKRVAAMSPAERQRYVENKQASVLALQHGQINPALICPHCQEKGRIRTKPVKRKKGVSGGKATAAILTAGVSMLATGLSRKEQSTEAYCGKCGSKWNF